MNRKINHAFLKVKDGVGGVDTLRKAFFVMFRLI
jgi:hypothetical protein